MGTRRSFLRRSAAAAALLAAPGCAALPRSGPLSADMRSAERPEDLEGLVAPLNAEVAERAAAPPPLGFPAEFISGASLDPTRIGVDDLLDITVFEAEGVGLFRNDSGGATLPGAVVDPSGRVFVPFAGSQPAAGATVAELRERIRRALEPLTLNPQVDVRLREPRSRIVTVQGAVARPGLYPIERPTARLSGMLASTGGAVGAPEGVEISVRRGGVIGRQILSELLDDPALDIALRPGDQIVLTPIRERFVVLGASSAQAEIPFPTRPLSLLSALGAARGLRDFDADPTGVFVFRYEDPALANALLPGERPPGVPNGPGRPIIYRLDFSEPEGLFAARRFMMRDGDAIFVTNAPLTELRKFLQLFNSVVAPVNTLDTSPVLN